MLDDHYVRVVKNAVEESAELLGYALILVASIGYVGSRRLRLGRSRPRAARRSAEVGDAFAPGQPS
jgi:hypothetical protein